MSSMRDVASEVLSLPQTDGAIRGLVSEYSTEKYSGAATFKIEIPLQTARNNYRPSIALNYSSRSGNGPFGMGWDLGILNIAIDPNSSVPRFDGTDSYVTTDIGRIFPAGIMGPSAIANGSHLNRQAQSGYTSQQYRPECEGSFSRIERWVRLSDRSTHWRVTSRNNVTSIYGFSSSARIANPNRPDEVCKWLLEEEFDCYGNWSRYEYAKENSTLFAGSSGQSQHPNGSQRYLRRILYGNSRPRLEPFGADLANVEGADFLYEVLFDYGDLPPALEDAYKERTTALEETSSTWPLRPDILTDNRPGYEVRTIRRCQRILVIHHFKELETVRNNGSRVPHIVHSMTLEYSSQRWTLESLLEKVTCFGHQWDDANQRYTTKQKPPIVMDYSLFTPEIRTALQVGFQGYPPPSLRDPNVALVDIDGVGVPDVVVTTGSRILHWRNTGNGLMSGRYVLHGNCSLRLSHDPISFCDMTGDGTAELLYVNPFTSGYYMLGNDVETPAFNRVSPPGLSMSDRRGRLVDLTGNGKTDQLVAFADRFAWYECKDEGGFKPVTFVPRTGEWQGYPNILFGSEEEENPAVFMADMNGDGLRDIVLMEHNKLTYWPNQGHGRFGEPIELLLAGREIAEYTLFDWRRWHIADLTGSGCADVVYVGVSHIEIWFNQCGTQLSQPLKLSDMPVIDGTIAESVRCVDFFGRGSNALVWSRNSSSGVTYEALSLCADLKPNLLTSISNGTGCNTLLRYESSVDSYLRDQPSDTETHERQRRWHTTLPFPVYVVTGVTVADLVRGTKSITEYTYSDGYWDGQFREFRGFGRVEQLDTNDHDESGKTGYTDDLGASGKETRAVFTPPALRITWFHTGAMATRSGEKIVDIYSTEYWSGGDQSIIAHVEIPENPKAYRALSGSVLREEIYSLHEIENERIPVTTYTASYRIDSVWQSTDAEQKSYLCTRIGETNCQYEGLSADPRISQTKILAIDDFGNITRSLSVARGRSPALATLAAQTKPIILYAENTFINAPEEPGFYRIGVPCQSRKFEVTVPDRDEFAWNSRLDLLAESLLSFIDNPETIATISLDRPVILPNEIILRLTACERHYYRTDSSAADLPPLADEAGRLVLGGLESLALPWGTYELALGPSHLEEMSSNQLGGQTVHVTGSALREAGYVEFSDLPGFWWRPSTYESYSPDKFFLGTSRCDQYGNVTDITYDEYCTSAIRVIDPLGNRTQTEIDYRSLLPIRITDPNDKVTEVLLDACGAVVASAVHMNNGKDGSLKGLDVNLTSSALHLIPNSLASADDVVATCTELLGDTMLRVIYDDLRFFETGFPNYALVITRQAAPDQPENISTACQVTITYCDGHARPLQTRSLDCVADVDNSQFGQQWVVSGVTELNGKGTPVQLYESYKSDNPEYLLERRGSPATLFVDALQREVGRLYPNQTIEKTVRTPWSIARWDANDTVGIENPQQDADIGSYFQKLATNLFRPGWSAERKSGAHGKYESEAAEQTGAHAATPSVQEIDAKGRVIRVTETIGVTPSVRQIVTLAEYDALGNQLRTTDGRGNRSFESTYNFLGWEIVSRSADAGRVIVLHTACGQQFCQWDESGAMQRTLYDSLRRPTETIVLHDGNEFATTQIIYGESVEDAAGANLRGRVYQVRDQAGVSTIREYDLNGNPVVSVRQLVAQHEGSVDWRKTSKMEESSYTTYCLYDALGHPTMKSLPDGSQQRLTYDSRGLIRRIEYRTSHESAWELLVSSVEYNSRAQEVRKVLGNGVETTSEYDQGSHRLISRVARTKGNMLQHLAYIYDPVGNITHVVDRALEIYFHDNNRISPITRYKYDSIYRVTEASGREHEAISACDYQTIHQSAHKFLGSIGQPILNGKALRNYTQSIAYDDAGNLLSMEHRSSRRSGWTRRQSYDASSNRIRQSQLGCEDDVGEIAHDSRGNMTNMPCLPEMAWDYEGRLCSVQLNTVTNSVPDRVVCCYDALGLRIRKRVERRGRVRDEQVNIGEFELRQTRTPSGTITNRAHIVTVSCGAGVLVTIEADLIEHKRRPRKLRYILTSQSQSSILEMDTDAAIAAYEEYYPFGGISFVLTRNRTSALRKRYRYGGGERDNETGLYYCNARYYCPWLGRWISPDPLRRASGINLYIFANDNPIRFSDPSGLAPNDKTKEDDGELRWEDWSFQPEGPEPPPTSSSSPWENLPPLTYEEIFAPVGGYSDALTGSRNPQVSNGSSSAAVGNSTPSDASWQWIIYGITRSRDVNFGGKASLDLLGKTLEISTPPIWEGYYLKQYGGLRSESGVSRLELQGQIDFSLSSRSNAGLTNSSGFGVVGPNISYDLSLAMLGMKASVGLELGLSLSINPAAFGKGGSLKEIVRTPLSISATLEHDPQGWNVIKNAIERLEQHPPLSIRDIENGIYDVYRVPRPM